MQTARVHVRANAGRLRGRLRVRGRSLPPLTKAIARLKAQLRNPPLSSACTAIGRRSTHPRHKGSDGVSHGRERSRTATAARAGGRGQSRNAAQATADDRRQPADRRDRGGGRAGGRARRQLEFWQQRQRDERAFEEGRDRRGQRRLPAEGHPPARHHAREPQGAGHVHRVRRPRVPGLQGVLRRRRNSADQKRGQVRQGQARLQVVRDRDRTTARTRTSGPTSSPPRTPPAHRARRGTTSCSSIATRAPRTRTTSTPRT